LKEHYPDYRNINISGSRRDTLPTDEDVIHRVARFEMDELESCSEEGPVQGSQTETEANALDIEANAPPAIETMVLDLNVTKTKAELIRKAISRPQALAPAPSIRSIELRWPNLPRSEWILYI
jgi:hypothetical protein